MRKLALILAFAAGLLAGCAPSFKPTWTPGVYVSGVPDSIARALSDPGYSPMSTRGLLMARDSIFDVDSVQSVQYDPPETYPGWWREMQACSGLRGSMEGWSWIAVPGDGFMVKGAGPFPGYAAVEQHNFLILRKNIHNKLLVQHEMLHALLWVNGHGAGHPPEFFDKCGVQAQ